jgi:hypothetical protein
MANWLEAAFGLGDEAESAPRRQAPEVKSFVCVVAQPSGAPGDLGQTVDCHYYVDGDTLTLCDQDGKAGDKSHRLAPGEDPRRVASRLRREQWTRESGRSRFTRPLNQSAAPYGGY